jgi:Rad3-related DNA helicase
VLTDENEYKYYEYLFKAKTHAQYANLVIINHSMLLQDLKSKNGTFAQMKNLVIDEAHNLEDTTTQALKKSFTVVDFIQNSQKTLATLSKNSTTLDNLETLFSDTTNQLSLLFDIF